MTHRKAATLAAGVCASVLILGSGIARADESAYVALLDTGGVPYDTPAGAVLMGMSVCASLQSGHSVEHNEHALMVGGRSAGQPDWTKAQADWLISAAVLDLCPQEQGVLREYGPPFFVSHSGEIESPSRGLTAEPVWRRRTPMPVVKRLGACPCVPGASAEFSLHQRRWR
jgi:hypothetical protein